MKDRAISYHVRRGAAETNILKSTLHGIASLAKISVICSGSNVWSFVLCLS